MTKSMLISNIVAMAEQLNVEEFTNSKKLGRMLKADLEDIMFELEHDLRLAQDSDAAEENVVEEKEDEVMVTKSENTRKLCSMLVGAWVWQSKYEKYNGKHLFYNSIKYPGYKIASRKRLIRVTGDVVKELFGDKYNNYETIREAWVRMAQYGFCSIRESDSSVFINDKQWEKLETQFNILRTNATTAGCKTMREYILR